MTRAARCRSCGHADLRPILDLGRMPLVGRLLSPSQLQEPEPIYPLQVAFCRACSLVQILEAVPPAVLFQNDYPYYSSVSSTWREHCRANALELIEKRGLNRFSRVVELASNDGGMLLNFAERGIPTLGIDPAEGPAAVARDSGIETLVEFFDHTLARKMVSCGRAADVVIGNNVLAHAGGINDFVAGVATLLKPQGVAVFEVPYLRDLIEHCEFDTIYHEHVYYFSVHALDALFRRHGLFLNDVRRLPTHGGSLRLYVERDERPEPAVQEILDQERALGMLEDDYYRTFADQVQSLVTDLHCTLRNLKASGQRIAAYGAAAKGCVLLNTAGIGAELIDYVVDKSPHKQGKYMPGVHLPIHAPARLLQDRPDVVLLLPWNFQDEILAEQREYVAGGGRFLVPVPVPHEVRSAQRRTA